jgi:predicted MFS family arabinose efflux permease
MLTTATFFHHISLMGSKGISAEVAASVFIIVGPTNMVGSFTAGFLADKFRNRYLLAAGQILLAISLIWLLTINSSWQALFYGGLIGFTIGFSSNINHVIWANYFGRQSLGSIKGISTTSMVVSSALGPLPFGLIFDLTGTYSQAILFSLAVPAICLLFALLARPPQIRTDTEQIKK